MDPSSICYIAVDGGVVVNRVLLEFPGGLPPAVRLFSYIWQYYYYSPCAGIKVLKFCTVDWVIG